MNPPLNLPVERESPIKNVSRYQHDQFHTLVERLRACDDYHIKYGQGPPLQKRRTLTELLGWYNPNRTIRD